MRNRGQLIFGSMLVLFGLMSLVSTVFQINLWPFCWSFGLIGAGVWLVLRPRMVGPDTGTEVSLFGDIRRAGDWVVRDAEFWLGVGDVVLDLTSAALPAGETTLRFFTFVSDVEVIVPRTVGVSVRALGFVVDSELLGRDYDAFFSPVEAVSDNYTSMETRLRVELTGFIADLKVRQI